MPDDIHKNVKKLWQLDVATPGSDKLVVHSKQDQRAVQLLERQTTRFTMGGIDRYATPLLRASVWAPLKAPIKAAMSRLRNCEMRLLKEPQQAQTYKDEFQNLLKAGYIKRLRSSDDSDSSVAETWYIPHHLVTHNRKDRIVFDCSFTYQGQSLNSQLLPGPALGPSLLGVLLRFREHKIAISGDIRRMFHQICLLPQDKPLLHFLLHGLNRKASPSVYECKFYVLAQLVALVVPSMLCKVWSRMHKLEKT